MIEKMTKYSFILLSSEKDGFLEKLREMGVVDITRSSKPVDEVSAGMMNEIASIKAGIKEIRTRSNAETEELKARIGELSSELARISHWGEFDTDRIEKLGVGISFFTVQTKKFNPDWAEKCALEIIDEEGGKTYFIVFGDASPIPFGPVPAPSERPSELEAEIERLKASLNEKISMLASRESEIPSLERRMAEISSDFSLYLASLKGEPAADNSLVVFEGFAPSAEDAELEAGLAEMNVYFQSGKADVGDNPPIKFRNNRFVRMFEPLTDMYGRPAYDGFDPTPFISIFFLLFFAMCMGDLGYGIILIIAGLLLKKVRSFASLAPLVVVLGAGTVIVGFFFHTFFSIDFSKWEWIPEGVKSIMVPASIAGYDGTMILALVIGILHLALAMIVKTFNATRNKGFLESLATWGWTVLFVGAVGTGAAAIGGFIETALVKTILIILGIICAIGIFPLNNLHRNPLKNIGSGLWDTYNFATGILGDVLSYLRLYALGLAGAMLGFAFNNLAIRALGDGGAGWIPFVLIVVIGHTLNLAMAALGAFVHPLRLNFLEFFKNSDYSGVGLKYNPLKKQ